MKIKKTDGKRGLFWDLKAFFSLEKERSLTEEIIKDLYFNERLSSNKEISDEEIKREFKKLERTVSKPAKKIVFLNQQVFKYAAVFIGFIFVAAFLHFYINSPSTTTVTTGYGEIREVKLPDNSVVILNAHSQLTYPTDWKAGKTREVTLKGEGYFKVRPIRLPQGKVKFQVHTQGLNVEVVGTVFNVSSRRKYTQVVLESGRVRIGFENQKIDMKPGEMVEVSKDEKLTHRKVNSSKYSSWTKMEWVLERTSLADIGKKIEDVYGIKVRIEKDSLRKVQLTGHFPTDNLNKLLKMLSASTNVKIKKQNNLIIMQ